MTLLLNPRVWLAIAFASFLAFTHFSAYRAGKANVREDFDAYKIIQSEERARLEKQYRDKEIDWQMQAAQTEETKNAEIEAINSRLSSALASLSKRPDRPAGNLPKTASACKGSTGAGLFRTDAEFLARLAASASRVAAERDACYQAYEALRK